MIRKVRVKGNVKVYDIPVGHETVRDLSTLPVLFDSKNVITDVGLARFAELLGGISTDFIDDMAIGDRGVNPSNIDSALAPDPTDTALVNEIIEKTIGSKSATANEVTLSTTFLTAEGPFPFSVPAQPVVNEYGLKASDGVLVARKTSASIPFAPSSRVGIIVQWTLTLL